MKPVAIIGCGSSGIAAARYLKSEVYCPAISECHSSIGDSSIRDSSIGGQWTSDNYNAGIWPQMRTNTARMVTRFSGHDYANDVSSPKQFEEDSTEKREDANQYPYQHILAIQIARLNGLDLGRQVLEGVNHLLIFHPDTSSTFRLACRDRLPSPYKLNLVVSQQFGRKPQGH